MDLAVLDATHVEVDYRFVILRADIFGALRMLERFLDLHTLERLDEIGCVLLSLPIGLFDRLLDEEDALPNRPVVAAGEDSARTLFLPVHLVHFHRRADAAVVLGRLVSEQPRTM